MEYNSLQEIDLFCNKTALNQVIVNILTNAYDFAREVDDKWIKLEIKDETEHFVIMISDSGPGISEENRVKIWEPFFTTKELGAGTGLGLSMAKGIVEKQHLGELSLNEGSPTTFVIKIPKNLESLGEGGSPNEIF